MILLFNYHLNSFTIPYHLHVFIVCNNKKTYIEYNHIDQLNQNICLLYKETSLSDKLSNYSVTNYSLLQCSDKTAIINNIQENYLKYENDHKPLKGISSYTLNELKNIGKKLNIKDIERNKKQNLYEMIYTFI